MTDRLRPGTLLPAVVAGFFTCLPSGAQPVFTASGQNIGSAGIAAAIADLDGNGSQDLVVIDAAATLTVYLNLAGSLTAGFSNATLSNPRDIVTADVDGDGDKDLVVGQAVMSEPLRVWLNQAADPGGQPAQFIEAPQSVTLDNLASVAAGQLDGVGGMDLYIGRDGFTADTVLLASSTEPGRFMASGQTLGTGSTEDIELADLDDDGDLDAVVAASGPQSWINQGGAQGGQAGQFTAAAGVLPLELPRALALGDIDGDGDTDAALADGAAVYLALNQGGIQGGTPGALQGVAGFVDPGLVTSQALALNDLDDDGNLDLVIGTSGPNQVWLNQGGVQANAGAQFIDSTLRLGGAATGDVLTARFDAGTTLDLFFANIAAPNRLWLNGATPPPLPELNPSGWQREVISSRGIVGIRPSLALDTSGHPHVVHIRDYPTSADGVQRDGYRYTYFDGVRWFSEGLDTVPFRPDAQALIRLNSQDVPSVLFVKSIFNEDDQLIFGTREFGSWRFEVVIADTILPDVFDLELDPLGAPVVALGDRDLKILRRTSSGWETQTVAMPTSGFEDIDLATDSSGTLYVAFVDRTENAATVAIIDSGSTMFETAIPEDVGSVSLAVAPNGTVYLGGVLEQANGLVVATRAPAGGWTTELASTRDLRPGDHPATVAVDAEGNPVVGLLAGAFGSSVVPLRHLTRSEGTWSSELVDDADRDSGPPALAISPEGQPVYAYHDRVFGDLRVATLGPRWHLQTVSSLPSTAPSLVERARDPHLAFYQPQSGLVSYGFREDGAWLSAGAAFSSQTVTHTSLALSNGDQPVISYADPVGERIRVSSGDSELFNPPVDIDPGPGAGPYQALLTRPPSAAAALVYWSEAQGQLSLARFPVSAPDAATLLPNDAGPSLTATGSGVLAAVQLDSGSIAVSYFDGAAEALRLALVTPDNTWTDEPITASGVTVSAFHDLAHAAVDDSVVVAFHDLGANAIRYGIRGSDGVWQFDTAVSGISTVHALQLDLQAGGTGKAHMLFADGDSGRIRAANNYQGAWTTEDILTYPGNALPEMSQTLRGRATALLTGLGNELSYLRRRSNLVTALAAPESFVPPYSPLIGCLSFLAAIFNAEIKSFNDEGHSPPKGSQEDLTDDAVFQGLLSVFQADPASTYYVELFRTHAREMGRIAENDPALLTDSYGMIQNMLPGLEALVTGAPLEMTASVMAQARDIWQRLQAAAGPELAAVIAQELARYDNLEDFVGLTWQEGLLLIQSGPLFSDGFED